MCQCEFRQVLGQAGEGVGFGRGQVGPTQRVTDAHEFPVIAVEFGAPQRLRVVDLVRGGDTPDDGGIVPAKPGRIVGVVGRTVGPDTFDGVVHRAYRPRQSLGGLGRAVRGPHEEGQRVPESGHRAVGIDGQGRGSVLAAPDQPRVLHTHPEDARVETLQVRRTLQTEDERGRVRMDVPGRAARAEPTRIAGRLLEVHPAEELRSDVGVELAVQPGPDELVREGNRNPVGRRQSERSHGHSHLQTFRSGRPLVTVVPRVTIWVQA